MHIRFEFSNSYNRSVCRHIFSVCIREYFSYHRHQHRQKTTTTFKWLPTEFGVDRHMYLNRIDTTGDGIYMVVPRVATWLKWNECFELCMVILNCRFFHHSADYHGRPLQSSDVCGSIKRYCVMAENICNRWISLDLRCNSRGINECFRLRANYGRNI